MNTNKPLDNNLLLKMKMSVISLEKENFKTKAKTNSEMEAAIRGMIVRCVKSED